MEKPPPTVTIFAPAKINLFLAVTGRRADGYHDLVSVAAPVAFGDTLVAEVAGSPGEVESGVSLECDDPEVPRDESNLVLGAARLFRESTGWSSPVAFRLTKRIPMGAGLGGGSSDAAAALQVLNQLSGARLNREALATLAAGVGSDCPLFLSGGPVVIRGRGEQIAPLPELAARRVRGRRVLLFKPNLSVRTAWAYERMAAGAPAGYLPAADADRRLAAWIEGEQRAEELLFNNLESVVFRKFIALPVLLARLRDRFNLAPRMSGSGSACFALLTDSAPVDDVIACIRDAWGQVAWTQITTLA